MQTRKLYYEDSHMHSFAATVLSCEKTDKGFEVILDATAFYPEGGGQAADTGFIRGIRVLDTQEQGEAVVHLCKAPVEVGAYVLCTIDAEPRFIRMQQHSGEHIVSGIIHQRYGYHNTGFHMGSDIITIDFDGVIPAQDLPAIEAEANSAVWQNLPVKCWYPSPEELPNVFYRTKKALPWPVRIVEIPGYDSCACCGTHLKATGEIGLIKLFSVVGFRGGTRMEMACGSRALKLLNESYEQNKLVSQAFSAKISETGDAARKMNNHVEFLTLRIKYLLNQVWEGIAQSFAGQECALYFDEGLDSDTVRQLADTIADKVTGYAAVFSGDDGNGYKYCLVSRSIDLRPLGKEMTRKFKGRGGGKPQFQQGRILAEKAEIEEFFQNRTL